MEAKAPGKLILFGEHAVVYDKPGIASAVDVWSRAEAEKSGESKIILKDIAQEIKTSNAELKELAEKAQILREEKRIEDLLQLKGNDENAAIKATIGKVISDFDFSGELKIYACSDIPIASGLGSGASIESSIAAAVQKELSENIDKKMLSEEVYLGESVCHGTPSGIDNSTVIFGKFIKFRKSEGIKTLDISTNLPIVVGNTKIKGHTGELVAKVRKLREEKTEYVDSILNQMEEIALEGIKEIEKGNLEQIGKLMNQNQECLRKLGVSHSKLEDLISIALKNGAYGAKLAGAGGGGIMYALCENEAHQQKLKNEFEKVGFGAIITKLGAEGVR